MSKPICKILFYTRIAITIATMATLWSATVAKRLFEKNTDSHPIPVSCVPVKVESYSTKELQGLAYAVETLVKKTSKLEQDADKDTLIKEVFEQDWLVYLLIVAPVICALLEVTERRLADRD